MREILSRPLVLLHHPRHVNIAQGRLRRGEDLDSCLEHV